MTDIRAWALAQQAAAQRDLDRASGRLAVLTEMLKQMPADGEAVTLFSASTKPKPPLQPVLKRLQEAGEAGLSSRELSEAAKMPIGTASSRLSNLRTGGFATNHDGRYFALHSSHDGKYFALHSSSEDNNVPQGGEAGV
jgi:hypothetical protein